MFVRFFLLNIVVTLSFSAVTCRENAVGVATAGYTLPRACRRQRLGVTGDTFTSPASLC